MNKLLFTLFLSIRWVMYVALYTADRLLSRKSQLVILSYHSVAQDKDRYSIDPETMKKQLSFLKKHYTFITLAEVEKVVVGKKKLTKPSVVVTIDDGYKDILAMQPFFKKLGIKPALFVLTNTSSANRRELGNAKTFLSQKELHALKKAGWEIGCHSATHANLASVTGRKLHEEVIAAKTKLEKEIGKAVRYFAYPRGKYSEQVLRSVKKANYALALSMDDGVISSKIDPFCVPRIGIDRTHSFVEFKATISPSVISGRKIIKDTFIGRYL